MKILQINSVCGIRSTGRICTDLEEYWNRMDVVQNEGHKASIDFTKESTKELLRLLMKNKHSFANKYLTMSMPTLNTKCKRSYHRGRCRRRNNVCAEETFAV